MSFDRATAYYTLDKVHRPEPPVVSFSQFKQMVERVVPDSDEWHEYVVGAYKNVPQFAGKMEYDIAVQTVVRSIDARKGMHRRACCCTR